MTRPGAVSSQALLFAKTNTFLTSVTLQVDGDEARFDRHSGTP